MTLKICMGGDGPPTTKDSRAIRMVGDAYLSRKVGERVPGYRMLGYFE